MFKSIILLSAIVTKHVPNTVAKLNFPSKCVPTILCCNCSAKLFCFLFSFGCYVVYNYPNYLI